MKLFAVTGGTHTERTAVAEKITVELKRRHQSVALILSDGTESEQKADKIFRGNTMELNEKMDLEKALAYITEDYVIIAYAVDMIPALSIDGTKDDLTFACTADFADNTALVDYIENTHLPKCLLFLAIPAVRPVMHQTAVHCFRKLLQARQLWQTVLSTTRMFM